MLKPVLLAAACTCVAVAQNHPTLPTMWTTQIIDPPQQVAATASYNFVDISKHRVPAPQLDNPDAFWENYTAVAGGDCNRLMYFDGGCAACHSKRFLIGGGCPSQSGKGSTPCCVEGDGEQTEFQIPNNVAHTEKVKSIGKKSITVFNENITADGWEFGHIEKFTAYTTPNASQPTGVTLHAWSVSLADTHIVTIQFKDWVGKADNASDVAPFKRTFHIPEICHPNKKCDAGSDDDVDDDGSIDRSHSAELRASKHYKTHKKFVSKWLQWRRKFSL